MIIKSLFLICVLQFIFESGISQKIIFLHHSTGSGVYYEGNVAGWIDNYNIQYSTNYDISERSYPNTPYPWANYPYDYWNLWLNNACDDGIPDIACLSSLCANYDIIIFKHCYPGAEILSDELSPSISSSTMTLANYKLQYRALRDLMDTYPNNRFIVWTLAPLHRLATDEDCAERARQFVDWVKNKWLTEDAKKHPNIYIFDFFGHVAESDSTPENGKVNCLKYDYEGSHTESDSHPNPLANETVGPIFAQFIVSAIENVQEVKVTSIVVSSENSENKITDDNGTLQLKTSIFPENATNKTVTWSIQNGSGQATISSTGLVTAIANGTVTVTITATDGSGVFGILIVTISNQEIQTGLKNSSLEPISISMDPQELCVLLKEFNKNLKLYFYNSMGNLLLSQVEESNRWVVNVSELPTGLYILVLSDDFNSKVFRIVKP
jgi:hypothetical protein